MKRAWLPGLATLGALVAVNAILDRRRECDCDDRCWCQTPLGRHVRWLVPLKHRFD
ncbi:hypothetical protein BH20ACT6_BH20ACT6_20590 [soil metagenome]